ncbi:hypothetical protein CBS101457_001020 [Exobasidium rhododendri]|nr:hypothetical protein CBS101457_001020 [Exobasidium rhododendri]
MATSSRRTSISTGSQVNGSRPPPNGTYITSSQTHPFNSRALSSQSHHHFPLSNSNPALLNTELRAQARKEREATRERSKEKLQQPSLAISASVSVHSGFNNRERSSSVVSSQQHGDRKMSPSRGLSRKVISRNATSRLGQRNSTAGISNENQPPFTAQQHFGEGRTPLQATYAASQERQGLFAMDDIMSQRQPFGNLASRIPSPPKGDERKSEFDSLQTACFVKYYYDMVEKCHSWQKYATSMKARAEALEIENRVLKDINEKQGRDIQSLESLVASQSVSHRGEGMTSASSSCSEVDSPNGSINRGESALSETLTVTREHTGESFEQTRRLRKVSISQQQQLQYLQARIHKNINTGQGNFTSGLFDSRPSSRMSNYGGVRGKLRSRAGSQTVHDLIPIAMDDVFSSPGDESDSIKRAESMPALAMDINNSHSGVSDLSDCKSGDGSSLAKATSAPQETILYQQQQQQQQQPREADQSGSFTDSDPKGAHRRLYIRLRDELEAADLVRFERYVHRYDALEIGIDGSRGIINRVKRLLLPEELVRSKAPLAERYRFRKELAREFERIVREDAIPKEGDSDSLQYSASDSGF